MKVFARKWPLIIYGVVVAAWIIWCLCDAFAGMFWLPLAVFAIPTILSCGPKHKEASHENK